MYFYDATSKRAICQKIDRLCDSNDTSYPRLDKTAEVNDAQEEVIGDLINADGTWQWDDTNYTDLPIGTQTLVASRSAYTFNDKFLQLLEVQIKDVNGGWYILPTIDQKEYSNEAPLEQDFETAGLPQYYDKVSDDTIKLYPAPTATNCTLASGLKIKFKRTAKEFTAVSTTAQYTTQPGFASPYHEILAYMASIPYCSTYKKDRVERYERKVGSLDPRSPYYGGLIKKLVNHYSQREKDRRKIATMAGINFR